MLPRTRNHIQDLNHITLCLCLAEMITTTLLLNLLMYPWCCANISVLVVFKTWLKVSSHI